MDSNLLVTQSAAIVETFRVIQRGFDLAATAIANAWYPAIGERSGKYILKGALDSRICFLRI